MIVYFIPSGKMFAKAGAPLDSTNTEARLEAALQYWAGTGRSKHDIFLVSGGKLLPNSIQDRSDAEYMAEWLEVRGVPKGQIRVEPQAADTFQNIAFGMRALTEFAFEDMPGTSLRVKVIIFSGTHHLRRFRHAIRHEYPKVYVEYCPVPRHPTDGSQIMEWLYFIIVHLFDPAGKRSRIARWIQEHRRACGQRAA